MYMIRIGMTVNRIAGISSSQLFIYVPLNTFICTGMVYTDSLFSTSDGSR
ncbi:Uncharacterised protein [Mycobacteroides abscessus subsp. abscessus]|nr:Uncharacterised protein [Mycobacteroides abscessus subsp. abscessus]